MDQDRVCNLSAAREQLGAAISAAIAEANSLPVGTERTRHLRGLATLLVGQPEELRTTVFSQCPELEAVEPSPDTLLGPEEHELVSRLTRSDLEAIDQALLASSDSSWRGVHRVIGAAMVALDGRLPGISVGLYVQRIVALVGSGRLLAEGNVHFMRLSKVMLPSVDRNAT